MADDQLLSLAQTNFQQEWTRIRSLAQQSPNQAGAALPAGDPPPTVSYSGYLDVEGFYWFRLDVVGFTAQDYNFHGSGESWILAIAQCEMTGQVTSALSTLSGVQINFTLTIGSVGPGGAELNFYDSRDGSLVGSLLGVSQGVATGRASGSGTFSIPS